MGRAVLNTFGDLWSGLFISAGIITLVFAIIERTAALDPKLAQLGVDSKWDPLTLPPLRKQDGKPTLIKSVCEMGFGFFGLIWLLLLPHYPVLILGPAAAFLTAAPLWHTFYVPILFMGLVGIARAAITLARPQWDWFPSLSQLFQTVLTLILLNFMIDAVGHVPRANWYPFVVLATAAQDSPQYIRLAAITNVSILISLASTWLGMCIAGAVQTWQFMQYLRKRNSSAHQPASLNV